MENSRFDIKLIFHLFLAAKKNDGIMAIFPKKKKKSENYNNGGMVRESIFHLQIHSKC